MWFDHVISEDSWFAFETFSHVNFLNIYSISYADDRFCLSSLRTFSFSRYGRLFWVGPHIIKRKISARAVDKHFPIGRQNVWTHKIQWPRSSKSKIVRNWGAKAHRGRKFSETSNFRGFRIWEVVKSTFYLIQSTLQNSKDWYANSLVTVAYLRRQTIPQVPEWHGTYYSICGDFQSRIAPHS